MLDKLSLNKIPTADKIIPILNFIIHLINGVIKPKENKGKIQN